MACPICFDDMDMETFEDERESTETCFKLECGHAFHTKCVVNFLTRTELKCPACNQHKTPEQELEHEGIMRALIGEIKKDDRVRIAKDEHLQAKNEYRCKLKQLSDESKEWVKMKAAELKIDEHKKYYLNTLQNVIKSGNIVAKEKGGKYVAAMNSTKGFSGRGRYWGVSLLKRLLFGKSYFAISEYRFRNPRIYVLI